MPKVFYAVLLFFTPSILLADEMTDFYFSAKSTVSIDLMHQAEYKKESFGAPFIFVEKAISGAEVLGLSPYGVVGGDNHGPDEYDNGSVPEWAFDLTQLAIDVEHWKALFRSKGITTSVWREYLVAYEDAQLARVRSGNTLDPLLNLNPYARTDAGPIEEIREILFRATYDVEETDCSTKDLAQIQDHYYTVWYHTCDPQNLMAAQLDLLNDIIRLADLSPAEIAVVNMLRSAIEYSKDRGSDRNAFLIWEPSCECGNGYFSVEINVAPPRDGILIASEFSFLVCGKMLNLVPTDLQSCPGSHQLGTGQNIHLSGDYRYQLTSVGLESEQIRSVRLRSRDVDGRTIVFSETGHRIRN